MRARGIDAVVVAGDATIAVNTFIGESFFPRLFFTDQGAATTVARSGRPLRVRRRVKRIAAGGAVLAPEPRDQPIQFIDVGDLARWILHAMSNHLTGG